MNQLDGVTREYLGETVKLLPTVSGWRAWWVHPVIGAFGDGMAYETLEQAMTAVQELIRRNGAIDALLILVDQWEETGLISELEHGQLEVSLLSHTLASEETSG